jgi:A/G-specific adenine glycosylase
MLQQTGTSRVLGKYERFLEAFPDLHSLARASLGKILRVWKGLGYNRRALALSRIAKTLEQEHGSVPKRLEDLLALPGIGKATAASILVFAHNIPLPLIETNVRRVFIHFFFPGAMKVRDSEILPLVEKTLDMKNPRKWYYALMDYGAMLKREMENPNSRSAHYRRQAPFEGSVRQIRGRILDILLKNGSATEAGIFLALDGDPAVTGPVLQRLAVEGFVVRRGSRYRLT